MRRRSRSVLIAVLAFTLLTLPTVASAALDIGDGDVAILAADDSEDLGPEPMPRDAEDNAARTEGGYEDQERQFTWGAAWLLLFLGVAGVVLLTGFYLLRVRPAEQARR